MSWMIRADQLDNDQNNFIFNEVAKGDNKWLIGLPGTGKSVILIHLILEKIEENPNVFICVVVFTNALKDMFIAAMEESKIPYENVYLTTYHQFIKESFHYEYIFCDEVQDLPKSVLENIKKRSNQLIFAGDPNQSIYKDDPQTHEKVVEISEINKITESKSYMFETIYRSTKSIVKSIDLLLPNIKIDVAKIGRKKDSTPRLFKGENEEQQIEYILFEAVNSIESGESVVILLPSHKDIEEFINIVFKIKNKHIETLPQNRWNKVDYNKVNELLEENQMNMEYLGNNYGDLYNAHKKGKIIFMTYHSSKGLDFDNVFLPFFYNYQYVENNFRNYTYNGFESLYMDEETKKTLFMVGMTRSKKNLYMTYSDVLPSYIETFKHLCTLVDWNTELESDEELAFDF
jgi:superfamily I DNA/RNA helicase